MKTRWININTKMPILNEIIYYKGNLHGQEAMYTGEDFVQLPNGRVDRFDEWKPKHPGQVTFNILHIDGVTKIQAKGEVHEGLFTGEYTYKGMCYGAAMPLNRIKQ
jgi:hypothetical protein